MEVSQPDVPITRPNTHYLPFFFFKYEIHLISALQEPGLIEVETLELGDTLLSTRQDLMSLRRDSKAIIFVTLLSFCLFFFNCHAASLYWKKISEVHL